MYITFSQLIYTYGNVTCSFFFGYYCTTEDLKVSENLAKLIIPHLNFYEAHRAIMLLSNHIATF